MKRMQSRRENCERVELMGNRMILKLRLRWLAKNRKDRRVCANIMKCFKGTAPVYMAEVFQPVNQSRIIRRSKLKLDMPFRNAGKTCLSYLGLKHGIVFYQNEKQWPTSTTSGIKSKRTFSKTYWKRKMAYMKTIADQIVTSNSQIFIYNSLLSRFFPLSSHHLYGDH